MNIIDKEFFMMPGATSGIFATIFLIGFGMVYVGEIYSCRGYEKVTGKSTQFVVGTCYIQDGNSWYSWEEYKNRFVAAGTFK